MTRKQIEYRLAQREASCRICGIRLCRDKDKAIFAISRSGQDSQVVICHNCVMDIIGLVEGV